MIHKIPTKHKYTADISRLNDVQIIIADNTDLTVIDLRKDGIVHCY